MNKPAELKATFKKSVAWAILLSMLNPAAMLPAYALDTDIYTSIPQSANVAQANIVIIIDTGDPMNVPEPWREYDPAVYDSHVEYLWNDPTYMGNVVLDLSNPFVWPSTEFGTWGGQGFPTSSSLPIDRTNLRNNAQAYAAATQAGDPGARNYWRNYGGGRSARNDGYQDARLVYWVPAGVPETDFRLRAPSFNRFYGNISLVAPNTPRGGITWIQANAFNDMSANAGTGGLNGTNGQTAYNQCKDSVISTTVDAAMTTAANTLATPLPSVPISVPMGLVPSTAYAPTSTPRNSGRYLNQQWQRWERFLNLVNGRAVNGDTTYPYTNATLPINASFGAHTIGVGSTIGNAGNTVTAVSDFLGAPATGGTPVRDSYYSNVNIPPPFGNVNPGWTGQPIRTQNGGSNAGWTSLKADSGGFVYWGAITNTTLYPAAQLALVLAQYQPTYFGTAPTAANAWSVAFKGNRDQTGPTPTPDMMNGTPAYFDGIAGGGTMLRLNTGGGATICTRTCNLSPAGGNVPNAPTVDANNQNHPGWWASTATCNTGTVTGTDCSTPPAACAAPPAGLGQYYNAIPQGCGWVGRQNVVVQGVGTYYYGGTCTGTCKGPGYVTGAQGGPTPCPIVEPNTLNCTIAGVSNPTINGTLRPNALLNNAGGGCNNNGNSSQTCAQREGSPGCKYSAYCNNTTVVAGNTTTDFMVYPMQAGDQFLYHECRADDPDLTNQNVPSGYMTNASRTFASGFNTTSNGATTSGYNPSAAVKNTAAPALDMYSVNYLNWKWGAKSNGNPIGRKTRLQIAKDALVTLVNSTNNVRFGLMNYNLTSNDGSNTNVGAHVTFSVSPMGTTDITDPAYVLQPNQNAILGYRPALIAAINNMVAGSRSPVTEALYEAYLYFRGEAPFGGLLTNCGATSVTVNAATIGTGNVCGGAAGTLNAGALINSTFAINRGNDNGGVASNINGKPGVVGVAVNATPAICNAAQITSGQCAAGSLNVKYASPMMNNPNPPVTVPATSGPSACQKNFVIAITEGQVENDGAANALIQALNFTDLAGNTWSPDTVTDTTQADTASHQFESPTLQTAGPFCAGTANEPFCAKDQSGSYQRPADNGYVWLDELAWYMSKGDMNLNAIWLPGSQPVVTYTIAFGGQTSPVIQNAAVVSGGQYYIASNSATLATALQQALAAIVAWNPSASTPTVPLAALNRAQSSTDVYLSFFGPSGQINWPGTVKKFQFDTNPPNPVADCTTDGTPSLNPAICLIGQTNLAVSKNIEHAIIDPVTLSVTTVVNPAAVSFWTPTLVGPIPAPVGGTYPLQDGGKANVGGTGHQLVITGTPAQRNMYTHLSTSGTAQLKAAANLMKDTNATITGTVLGNVGYTPAQVASLINWGRGGDIVGDVNCSDAANDAGTPCGTYRSWAHAAVLHSKPAVVTYNAGVNGQTVYYVSTDGVLHAVNASNGHEQWSFMVEEALPQLNNLLTNNAGAQLSIADGNVTVWGQNDVFGAPTGNYYLYFGLRRGGRAYYALNISNQTDPQFMWKITPSQVCTAGGGCSASGVYAELGQTWSTPAAVKLRTLGPAPAYPALIIGGGYDPNQDLLTPGADTMGRALYVVDGGLSGLPLKTFSGALALGSMAYAVPSDPSALNIDNNAQGYVNRIYIGDMGGNVFRFDVNDASATNWAGRKIAALGGAPLRKIFFPPVVVRQGPELTSQRFDAVYVGTGDKEHPLVTVSNDIVSMIKDTNTGFTSSQSVTITPASSHWLDITPFANVVDFPSFLAQATVGGLAGWLATPGWQFTLATTGEKVVASPEVLNNLLNFGTYSPTASLNACLPPGFGTLYGLNAVTGGAGVVNTTTGVLQPGVRTYAGQDIQGRGFVAPGGIIVIAGVAYRITVVDGALRTIKVGTLPQAKAYWQKEPEL